MLMEMETAIKKLTSKGMNWVYFCKMVDSSSKIDMSFLDKSQSHTSQLFKVLSKIISAFHVISRNDLKKQV